MKAFRLLILCLTLVLGLLGPGRAAAPAGDLLEDLQYQVSLGGLSNVALVHLRLSRTGLDRYRGEFSGAVQGAWKLLSRWLPESYETEMVLEGGCLKPLVYREKFQSKGQRVTKEYRFDYSKGVLELWRGVNEREPRKSWQVPLKGPVYDPLTLFYNLRLGALGPLAGGQTLKVAAIPDPDPGELEITQGPETSQGRKVMFTQRSKNLEIGGGPYFIWCTPQWVPLEGYMRVMAGVRLSGQLLNPGAALPEGLIGSTALSRHDGGIPK